MINNFEKIKNSKPFKLFDLLIYGVVLILALCLFLSTTMLKTKDELIGLEAIYNKTIIFSYDYKTQKIFTAKDFDGEILVENKGDTLLVKFVFSAKNNGYNILLIDKIHFSADITDSDCSNRSDCVHAKKIADGNASIICVPHDLIIRGVADNSNLNPPVVG